MRVFRILLVLLTVDNLNNIGAGRIVNKIMPATVLRKIGRVIKPISGIILKNSELIFCVNTDDLTLGKENGTQGAPFFIGEINVTVRHGAFDPVQSIQTER